MFSKLSIGAAKKTLMRLKCNRTPLPSVPTKDSCRHADQKLISNLQRSWSESLLMLSQFLDKPFEAWKGTEGNSNEGPINSIRWVI